MAKHSKFNRQAIHRSGLGSRTRVVRHPLTRVRIVKQLSPEAQMRLKCLEFAMLFSVALAAIAFQVHRSTIYRWRKQYNRWQLSSLEPRSRRPHRTRTRQWSASDAEVILRLRRENPGYGKVRLQILAQREGVLLSASTIGRMVASFHRRNLLVPSTRVRQIRRRQARPHAIRRVKGTPPPTRPGDVVQVDTMYLCSPAGQQRRQFTAIDVVSRTLVTAVRSQATAGTARDFLTHLQTQMPFPIRAIQVDGGSEFMGAFEEACQVAGITLYLLPPRSPKLNGYVERVHGSCRREFWNYYRDDWDLPTMNARLGAWTQRYNTQRPHTSLGFHSPYEWLADNLVADVLN